MKKIVLFLQSITIILFPAYILRFHIIIPTTLLELFLITTVILTFIDFLKSGASWNKLKTEYDLIILLFLFSATISVFQSADFLGGIGILRAYFFEPVLFFYCLIYQAKTSGNGYIIKSLVISGLWLSTFGLLQKLTGSYSLAPHEIAQGRISAVYNSANSLALYLGPISLLTLLRIFKSKNAVKVFYIVSFVLFILVILWTKSRGGLIAEIFSIAVATYALVSLKNKLLKKIWFIVPVVMVILTGIFFYQLYKNYNNVPTIYDESYNVEDTLQIRYYIWTGTINMLRDHPIFGAGLNGFKTLYTNQYRLPQYQEEFQYPHNLVLTFWAETGLLGLFTFLLILVRSFNLFFKNIASRKKAFLSISLISIMTYWVIHGIVDVPYFKNDLSLEFWTILALTRFFS